jgi:DNA-binding beta-propeller fold protein YncE
VYSTSDCSSSTIRIVDRLTQNDTQPEVRLRDCYGTPILLPGTSVLLSHWKRPNGSQNQAQDLGEVMYDWSMARIVKSYAPPSAGFTAGLASQDGTRLYTIDAFSNSPTLGIIDLTSGARLAQTAIPLVQVGLNQGGLALSIDGKTLYVNQGDSLATFDARTGSPGPVLIFKESKPGSTSLFPGWLGPIDADAKEGFEVGHGIAVDPQGRWIAALGADDRETEGVWLFSLKGTPHVVRRIDQNGGLGGIAFSLDGSVLYVIERQSYLVVIDPQTGQKIKEFRYAPGVYGIAGVEAP